jgi:flagellar FliL protein
LSFTGSAITKKGNSTENDMSKKKKKTEDETEEKDGAEADAPAEGAEGAEGEETPKKGKKKLIIIVAAVVLVLAIVGGLFAGGVIGGGKAKEKAKEEEAAKAAAAGPEGAAAINKPVYYELPEFLVNLNTASGHVSFLKMAITLELKDQASIAVMDANKPRVLDTFNTYLRELRATDVQGSAGIYRLRDELLTRLNGTVGEGVVKDILFSEIIVQ